MAREITERRRAKLERVLRWRQKDLTLVLANIHDPHNVSAIYRSADAFGVAALHLYYTDTAFPELGKKSSASARKWVESVRHRSAEELYAALKAGGHQILATSCTPESKPLGAYDFTKPTAVIMGNEHSGVPAELNSLVDGEVYIPMYGISRASTSPSPRPSSCRKPRASGCRRACTTARATRRTSSPPASRHG